MYGPVSTTRLKPEGRWSVEPVNKYTRLVFGKQTNERTINKQMTLMRQTAGQLLVVARTHLSTTPQNAMSDACFF